MIEQTIISAKEKSMKIVRYNGALPNELKAQMIVDGTIDHEKQQAIFDVQGVGMVLCETGDGEHWVAIAVLEEEKLESRN